MNQSHETEACVLHCRLQKQVDYLQQWKDAQEGVYEMKLSKKLNSTVFWTVLTIFIGLIGSISAFTLATVRDNSTVFADQTEKIINSVHGLDKAVTTLAANQSFILKKITEGQK